MKPKLEWMDYLLILGDAVADIFISVGLLVFGICFTILVLRMINIL